MDREKITPAVFAGLNERQREAVTLAEGPVLVIAGPGSGKTRALTHRVAYLIAKGVLPSRILAVTFTNKAAGEMRGRIAALLRRDVRTNEDDKSAPGLDKIAREHLHQAKRFTKRSDPTALPFIGTFHSFAASILRAHAAKIGRTRHFTIYDEDDRLRLVKAVMKDLNVSSRTYPPGMVVNVISNLKNDFLAEEEYARSADEPFSRTVSKIYEAYQRRLELSNALDFDDLLFFAVKLLREHPAVRQTYQERFQYIHVDEFQDVNPIQYELVKLLAEKHKNIFVIGDDSQSIYSWRRADPRLMFEFERDFRKTRVILLEENYRSTPQILEAANQIIRQNREQKEKTLFTRNLRGEPPMVRAHADEQEEADFIAEEILRLKEREGVPWRGFSILYRTNAQSRALEEAMLRDDIPYAIVGSIRFFERREIKDLVAYLKVLVNPQDREALGRILNVPPRGIGAKTAYAYLSGGRTRLSERDHLKIRRFEKLMAELKAGMARQNLSSFLKSLIKKIRYDDYLADGSREAEARIENIRELVSVAKKYDGLDIETAISRLAEEITLAHEQDELREAEDRVRLMTVHTAKGLEFPVVFIAGLEEGIFPHQKSVSASQALLEEERRLAYVGMTRAKHRLYLTFAYSRLIFGEREALIPSRFLFELPPEISKDIKTALDDLEEPLYVEE